PRILGGRHRQRLVVTVDSEMRGSALRNVIALGGGLLREGTGDQKNTTCPASLHDGDIVAPLRRRRPARGPHGRRQASTTVTSWPHCGEGQVFVETPLASSLHDGDIVAPLRRTNALFGDTWHSALEPPRR